MQETWIRSLGQEDPLEEEMAAHSSTFAWKIPWTEEPGGLQSAGSHKSWTQPSTHARKSDCYQILGDFPCVSSNYKVNSVLSLVYLTCCYLGKV